MKIDHKIYAIHIADITEAKTMRLLNITMCQRCALMDLCDPTNAEGQEIFHTCIDDANDMGYTPESTGSYGYYWVKRDDC